MTEAWRSKFGDRSPLFGTLLSLPSPEAAEILAEAGFDWLFLDMEHGGLDISGVRGVLQAVAGRTPCVVRVPQNEPNVIARALDAGADGLIFPHVSTADEARACVAAALYPPEGTRSIGLARAQGYGIRVAESLAGANHATVRIAQAEHFLAARNIGEILAVPGIDAVFIGPFDLSGSLGKPGRISDPEVVAAIRTIREAATAAGIPAGIYVADAEAGRTAAASGFGLITVATDALLLGKAARLLARALKTGVLPEPD
jgi:2-dehydro-3-deoxyglucarate aldolase/4-hydroxy-2-oxoheptanedioate aldolase